MGLFSGLNITRTVTGIAASASGKLGDFRKVLAVNPSSLSLLLPPQVQLGISIANQIGLKVPTADQLQGKVNTEIQNIFKGLTREAGTVLDSVDGKITTGTKTVEGLLSSIDWLL